MLKYHHAVQTELMCCSPHLVHPPPALVTAQRSRRFMTISSNQKSFSVFCPAGIWSLHVLLGFILGSSRLSPSDSWVLNLFCRWSHKITSHNDAPIVYFDHNLMFYFIWACRSLLTPLWYSKVTVTSQEAYFKTEFVCLSLISCVWKRSFQRNWNFESFPNICMCASLQRRQECAPRRCYLFLSVILFVCTMWGDETTAAVS